MKPSRSLPGGGGRAWSGGNGEQWVAAWTGRAAEAKKRTPLRRKTAQGPTYDRFNQPTKIAARIADESRPST